ncbi:MAG TPA: hypothetical protein DDY14_07630, partial [Chromatiaceae bacterium]|nr:hypothetical protein [Chromatiaceae bacterium]
ALLCCILQQTAASDSPPSPVILAAVVSESLHEQVVLSGTTEPIRYAELSPRVDGWVTELFVDEGALVEQGEPVLRMDARLAELETEAAMARVQEREAQHRDAIRIRDELLSLKQGRHASKTETQTAIANVEIAAAALSGERASLERARELVKRHALAAPFTGMVVSKNVEVGEWAKRDQAAIELVALDRLRIRATLPQRDYPRVAAGASASLRFDALPERDFVGEVSARVASGDQRTRGFPLLIDLPNPDGALAPGMSARVRVDLSGGHAQALTIPRDAVIAKSDGSREVWQVRLTDGIHQAYPVAVETGRANGDRLELLRGDLRAGDRLVLLGNERLRPGQRVAPAEAIGDIRVTIEN